MAEILYIEPILASRQIADLRSERYKTSKITIETKRTVRFIFRAAEAEMVLTVFVRST
ncbi:MAG TPA: hypothetical protein VK632_06040 [Verrucomicrobiae bacterium]|nr:hypothetical protein [Verrucomicrobiae bacterium]